MKKAIFTVISLLMITLVFAQSPQSFKYQAVIRDSEGVVIANEIIGLQISILEGSESGAVVYTETWAVATNNYGLINLNIGEGTSSDNFSAITWGTNNYYVQLSLDENGGTNYTDMGVSQLLSVPYALYANQAGGSISSPWVSNTNGISYSEGNVEIITTGVGLDPELPLFEVRNNAGIVVFAVYNEGVRMNVDNASASHSRGGFAIGGQNQSKGTLDYFQVTPDSVRIYLDESAKPTSRGGFAIGGQNMNKTITSEYLFINTDSTRITTATDGGFGIASKTAGKTGGINFIDITPDNMFVGQNAGVSTSGLYNSFFGYQSGYSNTEGHSNIFLGTNAGYGNTIGYDNIIIGNEAGLNSTTANSNLIIGNNAGKNLTNGFNIFIGTSSGELSENVTYNTFIGRRSGRNNISGESNTYVGFQAGEYGVDDSNTAIGVSAGRYAKGANNVYVGAYSGLSEDGGANNTGYGNTFVGRASGFSNTSGYYNTFIGRMSGDGNTTGYCNTNLGRESGALNTSGNYNTLLGYQAGEDNQTGSNNILIGSNSGTYLTDGERNIMIGSDVYSSSSDLHGNDLLIIGSQDIDGNDRYIIYGEMDNNYLEFNTTYNGQEGKVNIKDVLRLNPRATAPTSAETGDMYYDSGTNKLKIYNGTDWKTVMFE